MVVALSLPVAAVVGLALLAAGVAAEHRLGVVNRLVVLWHGLVNADARLSVTAVYETGQDIGVVRDELKYILREEYSQVVEDDDADAAYQATVDDWFDVTLAATDDGVQVETSTIVTTMRGASRDVDRLFTALAELEERTRAQAPSAATAFAPDRFQATLTLPHRTKYATFHLPTGTALQRYDIGLDQLQCTWDRSREAAATTTVTADTRTDLRGRVRQVLGPFLRLYPAD